MVAASFSHVRAWVFDLDNTLYPPEARLFDQIEVRMTDFVQRALGVDRAEADRLRASYWARYGTTLAGLMNEHGVDPGPHLYEVHEIGLSHLDPDPDLAAAIQRLPGRRIVYTNGSKPYAERVLAARGLPSSANTAFEAVFALDGLAPEEGAMFEDDIRNLAAPHAMGMRTVHVGPEPLPHPHIHHHTSDLAGFLSQLG